MRSFLQNNGTRVAFVGATTFATLLAVVTLRNNTDVLVIAWSALILASFVGWGSLVNLWLAKDRWADWGLRAGWGMGLVLAMGGYFSAAHIARRPVLLGHVLVGVGILLWTWVIRRPPSLSSRRFAAIIGRSGVVIIVLGAYAITAFLFCLALSKHDFQPSDDPPLYFEFPKKLLETGSLYEPFNPRRITTLGGQPYLHGVFLSVAPFYYLHVVDCGIGLVLMFALVVGHFTRTGLKGWHAVPLGLSLLLLFSLLAIRVNTASEISGVPVILALYRTLRFPLSSESDAPRWPMNPKRVIVLAVLAVAAALLRTSNAAAVMPFLVLVFTHDFLLATRRPWQRAALKSFATTFAIFFGAFVLTLLPWSVMLHESCRTFLFPLQQGNLTPGWVFLKTIPLKKSIANWILDLSFEKPIFVFAPFIVAGLAPLKRGRNDVAFLTVGSLIGVWELAHTAGAFDNFAHARYSHAYLIANALVIAMSVEQSGQRAALVATALAMHITNAREELRAGYLAAVDVIQHEFLHGAADERGFAAGTATYADLQAHIPPQTTMVTAVHEPWRFDFRRNRIFTLDILGGAGPKPGWPSFKGPQALIDYFRANGVRYVAWTDFDTGNEFYNRPHWKSFNGDDYLGGESPFEVDGMDTIDKFATMRHVVYRNAGMTLVDLDTAH